MYRDPRNFFASAMKGDRKWFRDDVTAIAHWNVAMKYGERLQKRYGKHCTFVNQEDLLIKPGKVIAGLLKFCSVDWAEETEHLETPPSAGPFNSSFPDRPLSSSNIERFAYTMEKTEIYAVELLTAKYFQKYFPQKEFSVYCRTSDQGTLFEHLALRARHLFRVLTLEGQIYLRNQGRIGIYFRLKKALGQS
jgi:hypothetical protein